MPGCISDCRVGLLFGRWRWRDLTCGIGLCTRRRGERRSRWRTFQRAVLFVYVSRSFYQLIDLIATRNFRALGVICQGQMSNKHRSLNLLLLLLPLNLLLRRLLVRSRTRDRHCHTQRSTEPGDCGEETHETTPSGVAEWVDCHGDDGAHDV